MEYKNENLWAVILGGSSGFGLATAKKLSSCGMNVCVVHRDRRGVMERVEKEFETIKATGVNFKSFNLNALSAEGRAEVLDGLSGVMGSGKVRVLLHSIAFGSLKLLAPKKTSDSRSPAEVLAAKLGLDGAQVQKAVDELFADDNPHFGGLASTPAYEGAFLLSDEEMAETIYAMGTSMYSWTRDLFTRGMFAADARVLGLTSEGNEVSWYGYAAVSAAKTALEAVSRSIAREFAPHGIRSNVLQPGITDTPALRLIPGNAQLSADAMIRNPLGRLTTTEDVAKVVALLVSDDAAWINGSIIPVDGGECIAG